HLSAPLLLSLFSTRFSLSIVSRYTLLFLTRFCVFLFFFNDTAPTEIYTLSLHDALPICLQHLRLQARGQTSTAHFGQLAHRALADRKSTRLNSSHVKISYAVFCLKKKKKKADTRDLASITNGTKESHKHECDNDCNGTG